MTERELFEQMKTARRAYQDALAAYDAALGQMNMMRRAYELACAEFNQHPERVTGQDR